MTNDDDAINQAVACLFILAGILIISSYYFGLVGFGAVLILTGLQSIIYAKNGRRLV